jgi:hypothetical protein
MLSGEAGDGAAVAPEGVEEVDAPTSFAAETVNVRLPPSANPVNAADVAGASTEFVHPSSEVTMYSVRAAPPSFVGGFQWTVA